MPFHVIVMKNNVASITSNWDIVEVVRQVMSEYGYSKTFETEIEAEKYVKDHKFKFMSLSDEITDKGKNNEEKQLKRKQAEDDEEHLKQVKSIIKNHIKKIKMSFNGLQVAVSDIPEFSSTCPDQIQTLNDKVAFKLHEMLKIKKKENQGNDLPSNKQPSASSSSSPSSSKLTTSSVLSSDLKEEAKQTFSYNDKNEVIAYCEGSYVNSGIGEGSAESEVWFGIDHFLNMAVKVPGLQTNNCAVIYSIVHALQRVKSTGLTKINIRTDSQFIIKSVNEWIQKWKVDGWKTAGGSEIKCKQLFVVMLQDVESMDSCTWTYVPAHKGGTENEEANKLAKAGSKM